MANYNAFISYSHAADGRLAAELQDALQRFAKPWNRRRALRVFRDGTGLSVSVGLWPAIQNALEGSDFFILMASPAAAQSEWVNKEVSHWTELNQGSRLLPVVTEGEWVWDATTNDFDWDISSAVPPALQGVLKEEPRHLDLRWANHDGAVGQLDLRNSEFRSAVADLAAPIHGKDKDELEGQDLREFKKARLLRRIAIAGLVILAIALSIAAVLAVNSAREALRQEGIALENAVRANAEADRANAEADRANAEAELATARLLAAQSRTRTVGQTDLSLLLAVESIGLRPTDEGWAALAAGLTQELSQLTPLGEPALVSSVALSADGAVLAASGSDTISLWNPTSREPIGEPLHFANVESVALTKEGTQLAAVSSDGFLRVWDTKGLSLMSEIRLGDTLGVVALSPDGTLLAAGGLGGTLWLGQLHDPRNAMRTIETPFEEVRDLAFSPVGDLLAAALDSEILLVDTSTGQAAGRPAGHDGFLIESVDFSSDGLVLVSTARSDPRVRFWDMETLEEVANFVGSDLAGTVLSSVTFRPGGYEIVWTGLSNTSVEARVRFWDLGTEGDTREPIASFFWDAEFSEDGSLLVLGNSEGVHPWVLGEAIADDPPMQAPSYVNDLAIDPDSGMIAVAGWSGEVYFLDPVARAVIGSTKAHERVETIAFSPSGSVMATGGAEPPLLLWQDPYEESRPMRLPDLGDEVRLLAFNPEGTLLAVAAADSDLLVVDVATGRLAHGPFRGHVGDVTALAFTPDGTRLVTGGDDGAIWQWNLETGEGVILVVSETQSAPQPVTSIAIDPAGTKLTTASGGRVQLWSLDDRAAALVAASEVVGVSSLHFMQTAPLMMAASSTGISVLSSETLELATFIPGESGWVAEAVAVSPNEDLFVAGYSAVFDRGAEPVEGLVHLWRGPAEWLDLGCVVARRALTSDERERFLTFDDRTPACGS